jgi:hypothetical protein
MAENVSESHKQNDTGIRFGSKLNGVECKTPFLIGVAGGTASGKVSVMFACLRSYIGFSSKHIIHVW